MPTVTFPQSRALITSRPGRSTAGPYNNAHQLELTNQVNAHKFELAAKDQEITAKEKDITAKNTELTAKKSAHQLEFTNKDNAHKLELPAKDLSPKRQ
jgi:hypothetical protein